MRASKTFIALVLALSCLISFFPAGKALAAESDLEPPMITAADPSDNDENNIVVYINWDGFAGYYVTLAEQQGKIPTLSRIKNEDGVFFANAYSGMPSVTNPMQAAIASGTTSRFTDNHYRYFNKKLNRIIQDSRPKKMKRRHLPKPRSGKAFL